MRPRKNLLLYCSDENLESRIRLVLKTRLSVVVFSAVEQPDVLALTGFLDAAVVWQNDVGKDLSERLRGNGVGVLEVALPLQQANHDQKTQQDMADLFCGAGGMSQGLLLAANDLNAKLKLVAVNHWDVAIATHELNHPGQRHECAGLAEADPCELVPGGYLDLLCAAPECTHHSNARGGKPMNDQSRSSPMLILDWLTKLYVKAFVIENIPEFAGWGPLGRNNKPLKSKKGQTFQAWLGMLRSLGYKVEWKVLTCADYGAPTIRRRLFVIGRRDGKAITWPRPSHIAPPPTDQHILFADDRPKWRTAREIIDWSKAGKNILTRKKPLADKTLRRIEIGIREFCGTDAQPFLIILRGTGTVRSVDEPLPAVTAGGGHLALVQFLIQYYGSSDVASVDAPLPTVTTKDRFGLVTVDGAQMQIRLRMLTKRELARAQGFADSYKFTGNETEVGKQIGNAVPPPMAQALALELLQ